MLAVNQRSKAELYTHNKFTHEYKNKERIINDDINDEKKRDISETNCENSLKTVGPENG
jgi:hypothetical protein